MVVDGGFCAFICDLPDHEKLPVFDPTTGIHVSCPYQGGPIRESEARVEAEERGEVAHPLRETRQRERKREPDNRVSVPNR